MEKVGEYEQNDMRKKMESMQKYIEVLEDLRNALPFHVKRFVTENENLEAEIIYPDTSRCKRYRNGKRKIEG